MTETTPPPSKADKVTEYGQWPTVWAPPPAPVRRTARQTVTAMVVAALRRVALVAFLIGPPTLLWVLFGSPTSRLPTGRQVSDWFTDSEGRLTGSLLGGLALAVAWLIWVGLTTLIVAEVIALAARIRLPVPRLPAPLHRLMFGLAGTAVLTITSTEQPALSDTAVVATAAAEQPVQRSSADGAEQAPATIHVAMRRYAYLVRRGDTMSRIARDWLGDANRWPEICHLNRHRHWQNVGGSLRDCDLIYPGWDLRLPSDARPPAGTTTAPPIPPKPTPEPGTTTPPDPDGVTEPSPTPATPNPPTATPAPAHSTPTETQAPRAPHTAGATPPPKPDRTSPAAASDDANPRSTTDDNGVYLPDGSFLPWSLAAAITAAAAMVWLQRRRRFTPHADDSDGSGAPPLPAPVPEVHRRVTSNPNLATPTDPMHRATTIPDLPPLPPGGIGLTGEGAHAAARAALVIALASGGPHNADHRGEVIIDAATWTALFGEHASPVRPWPRLRLTADLDHALTLLDSRLLHRARILDEHNLTDLTSLREHSTGEEALPPILLICQTPSPGTRMRAHVGFNLGKALDVSALLLGAWPHGTTVEVTADGRTRTVEGTPTPDIGERVGVLSADAAAAILTTLREAHTGQPPTSSPGARDTVDSPTIEAGGEPVKPPAPDTKEHAADVHRHTTTPTTDNRGDTAAPATTVQLRVLGYPRVDDLVHAGRALRAKAAELAVYLACHPDGADTRTIAEHLAPDYKVRAADQQVHTNASNLRHVLGRAGGFQPGQYLLKQGAHARYRLDPSTVNVDLWQLRDLLRQAHLASTPARTEPPRVW